MELRKTKGAGEATISLWYGKLLAQGVADRLADLGRPPITSAVYLGSSDANGGPDRRLRASEPASALPSGICRRVAHSWARAEGVPVARVDQIEVLGGACSYVLEPQDVRGFVADAGGRVSGLRALPGGPNARPSLIEVVDRAGALEFVLSWIPNFAGAIGQGAAWVQPGWRSSAIVGQPVIAPRVERIPPGR